MKILLHLTASLLMGVTLVAGVAEARDSLNFISMGADHVWEPADCIGVRQGVAYIGTTGSRLHVVNIARPDHPIELNRFSLAGVCAIDFTASLAVAAVGQNGWVTMSIQSPQDPFVLSRTPGETVNAVSIRGNYALIGTESGKLISYDLNNPGLPEERSRLERLSAIKKIILQDTLAWLATANGLATIDIRDLQDLQTLSRFVVRGNHTDLAIDGTYAYMLDSPDTLRIIDIRFPAEMRLAWNMRLLFPARRMLLHDRYIYLSAPDGEGFNILDRWDPDNPDTVGFYRSCWGAAGMTLSDGTLWTAGEGLTAYSLREPAAPDPVGHIGFRDPIVDIGIAGDRAHLVTSTGALLAGDITDPRNPSVRAGMFYFDGEPDPRPRYRRSETHSFVITSSEIRAMEISDYEITPAAVTPGYLAQDGEILGDCAVDDGRVSVVTGDGGWIEFYYYSREFDGEFFDTVRHESEWRAESIASFGLPGVAVACRSDQGDSIEVIETLYGSRLKLRFQRGSRIILRARNDVVALAASSLFTIGYGVEGLVRMGRYDPEQSIEDLSISGGFAAVLEGARRITILNVTNPYHPYRTGYYTAATDVLSIELSGDYLYASSATEFRVFDVRRALEVTQDYRYVPMMLGLSAFPNPFNSSTTISYSLPSPGRYAIDVIDIQGRLVTRLSDGWREAGSYREVLNGGQMTNGQYLIRLNSNIESFSRPITIIK